MADFKTALQLRHGASNPTGPREQLTQTKATEDTVPGAVQGVFES